MEKRKYYSEIADQEIIELGDSTFLDDWIEPEMLRRCAIKYKTLNGELTEEQEF